MLKCILYCEKLSSCKLKWLMFGEESFRNCLQGTFVHQSGIILLFFHNNESHKHFQDLKKCAVQSVIETHASVLCLPHGWCADYAPFPSK